MVDRDSPSVYRLTADADEALRRRDYRRAATLYQTALDREDLRPYLRAVLLANLGFAWQQLGDDNKASESFASAVATNPRLASAQLGLANMRALRGRHAEALAHFDEALRLDPTSAIAHANRALSLEALGRIEESWQEAEWRYSIPAATSFYPHRYAKPKWKGEPLHERTLLVHREQGLGDVIQYLRFLPLLRRYGGRVKFECPPPLLPLVSSMPGVEAIATQEHPVPEDAFDCYLPLLSLPYVLGFKAAELPGTCPYVSAGPSAENAYSKRWGGGPKIGFAWAGSAFDPTRNAALADFLPLAEPKAQLVSLQKDRTDGDRRLLSERGIEDAGSA